MKYRKKPVIIEAIEWNGLVNGENIPEWFRQSLYDNVIMCNHRTLMIKTLEGIMRADYGDYIIKGIRGEIYPCKPDIFELTYEAI